MIKRGFSLMEMMIVLLIVAIITAAAAPVINKNLLNKGSDDAPWKFTRSGNIAFNTNNHYSDSAGNTNHNNVLIGRGEYPSIDGNKQTARLYVDINNENSNNTMAQIALGSGDDTVKPLRIWSTDLGGFSITDYYESAAAGKPMDNTIAIGHGANNSYENSIAIGKDASAEAASMTFPISIGYNAKSKAGEKTENNAPKLNDSIAIGYEANAGDYSLAIGSDSGSADVSHAVSIGYDVKPNNSTAVIGANIVQGNEKSVAIGQGVEYGQYTTAIGSGADATGASSVAIGYNAKATVNHSVAIGENTRATVGQGQVLIGDTIGADDAHKIATNYNTIVGVESKGGYNAVTIGNNATAENSVSIGHKTDSISNSVIIGTKGENAYQSVDKNTVLIGSVLDGANDKNDALAIGYDTTIAHGTVAIGHGARVNMNDTSKGSVALGANTYVRGGNSIAIGEGAETNGNNAVAILNNGLNYNPEKAVQENEFRLGDEEHTVVIPGHLDLAKDGTITLGDSNATIKIPGRLIVSKDADIGGDLGSGRCSLKVQRGWLSPSGISLSNLGYGNVQQASEYGYLYSCKYENLYTNVSDRRVKNVGEEFKGGLAEIKKLEPFHFTFKKDKEKTPQVGVMAQDLQKVFPTAVFKANDGFLRIRWDEMFYALVNAVKELDKKIDLAVAEYKKLAELRKQNAELRAEIADIQKQVKKVQKKIAKI